MKKDMPIERLDYLPGLKRQIYQRSDIFSYSMDAILLAKFVTLPKREESRIIDLCTGTGAVPLVMSLRTRSSIDAVEIQPLLASLSMKSMRHNNIHNQVNVIEADIRELQETVTYGSYHIVTCNPPYFPVTAEKGKNLNEHLSIARHEVMCTLEDVIRAASKLLIAKGIVALVHRPERLVEIVTIMKQYQLEPKRLQYVHPNKNKEANMVLIEAVKEGRPSVKILPPWIVYGEDHTYTKEFKAHYE
ncbi:tRNA1(Val) (adenine(37)-N6)-methyltransferase [Bacillus sp. A116_S68]|nr:tRNA1(Val) (adenine(37)-N6)-methyltransferase [Bacillus sp. A116_S68]